MPLPASQLPRHEASRLLTLRHYRILNTPPEAVFEVLVALAAHVFHLPQAFLALVDAHEVSFPATHGVALAPVPRAEALCSTAIQHPHAIAYENLALAPQSGPDAPAVRALLAQGGRFYAAAPLRMPDGHIIGVLCLAGPQPRPFSPDERRALEALADVASQAIAVRHLCLATPELGADEWRAVQQSLCPGVLALRLLLDELLARHGTHVPVPPAVLHAFGERLHALRVGLTD